HRFSRAPTSIALTTNLLPSRASQWSVCAVMVNCAFQSRLRRFARRYTISRLSAFRSTSASVEPRNFSERRMAESVFSPKIAEPAPITLIFVGRDMYTLLCVWLLRELDAAIIKHPLSAAPFDHVQRSK